MLPFRPKSDPVQPDKAPPEVRFLVVPRDVTMDPFEEDLMTFRTSVRPLRSIATELKDALKGPNQFNIRYQPIFEGKSKQVALAEALLRWTSPVLGEVSPGRFIHIAEQNGLIRPVTRMVLRRVCEDICQFPDLVVSVNVSKIDLTDPEFADEVAGIMADYKVSPKRVILECTDSITPQEAAQAAPTERALRQQGHSVAIYELDSGFTSFGFINMSGYTLLKVDRVLIDEALQNQTSRENLQEALDDCKERGLKTLAFGVETSEQAALVEHMGFDLQQGYFHSRSLSFDELMELAGLSTIRPTVANG